MIYLEFAKKNSSLKIFLKVNFKIDRYDKIVIKLYRLPEFI